MGKHPRQIEKTWVRGVFGLPMGLSLFAEREPSRISRLLVSTVLLDGGHLEAPIPGLVAPESGYETAVFFDRCSFFTIYSRKYGCRAEAVEGHAETLQSLLAGTLPLTIALGWYCAWDHEPASPDD